MGSQIRRNVVRMSTPDLRWGKVGTSSDERSTADRVEHSTSPGLNTGRPLAVISAAGRKAPAMVDRMKRKKSCWVVLLTEEKISQVFLLMPLFTVLLSPFCF